jgi:hypothetical protein
MASFSTAEAEYMIRQMREREHQKMMRDVYFDVDRYVYTDGTPPVIVAAAKPKCMNPKLLLTGGIK